VPNRQRSQLDLERVVDVGVGKDQQPVVVEQPAQGVRGLPFRERYVVQPPDRRTERCARRHVEVVRHQ
jgi:hypothetical protein